jgi:hypothetical protein
MERTDLFLKVAADFMDRVAKMRPAFRVKRRRSALDRLHARMRYRRNREKIRIWRRRYNERRKLQHNARKLLKRTKPVWFGKSPAKASKHHPHAFKHFLKKMVKGQTPNSYHAGRPQNVTSPTKFKIFNPKFRTPKPLPVTPN